MLTVYGIKSCDGCRKALKWLTERGHAHRFVDFREQPVPEEKVHAWVDALGNKALRNTSGGSYRALPPEKKQWSEERWKHALASDVMLIKRPVLERDGTALTTGFRGWEALL